jgi:Hydantoinase B/oxoprolinase
MSLDPIVTSVIQHRLHAIVEEMGEAMLRTAYSQILNSSRPEAPDCRVNPNTKFRETSGLAKVIVSNFRLAPTKVR